MQNGIAKEKFHEIMIFIALFLYPDLDSIFIYIISVQVSKFVS